MTKPTTEQILKTAHSRAWDLRKVDVDGARELSDALTDLLCATDLVAGLAVDVERAKVDCTTVTLLDKVVAAKEAYDAAAVELSNHVCETLELRARPEADSDRAYDDAKDARGAA